MKRRANGTEQLIAAARPADQVGFTATAQGEAVLAGILDLPREPERPARKSGKFTVAGVVVAGLVVAGGTTAAIGGYHAPTAPPEALPANGEAFVCATAGLKRMGDTWLLAGETPVTACRRAWPSIFDQDAPKHLYPCVQRVEATPSPPGDDAPAAPAGTAAPSATGRGTLVYVVDGAQFKDPAQTCGAVGMLVAPIGN